MTDAGYSQAFRHNVGDAKMTALGTLKADNSGTSIANAVSADGRIVVGVASGDLSSDRAVVWLRTTAVDIESTREAMVDTAHRSGKMLDLYQSSLNTLADSRCQIGQSNYCVGVFTQFNHVSRNQGLATGVFGAVRLPNPAWTAGLSVNLATGSDLHSDYKVKNNVAPGIGSFIRYQPNTDGSGLKAELAGAYQKQRLSIQRATRSGSEAGKGNSDITGYTAKANIGYGINLTDKTQLTPLLGLNYNNVARAGYTEHKQADFLASYKRMGTTSTELQAGVVAQHQLSPKVAIDTELGSTFNLHRKRDVFRSDMEFFGKQLYQHGDSKKVRPYVGTGVNFKVTENSTIRTNLNWQQQAYSHDGLAAGVSYSYHW